MEPINEIAPTVLVDLDEKRHQRGQQTTNKIVDATFCQACKNTGYVRADVPFGHPQFGKALECECTKARKKAALRQALWKQSRIDQLATFQEETFESFQFWRDGTQEAYDASEAYASSPKGWLVLQGPHGCGKTHLAVAIAKQCLAQERTVLFAVVPELLEYLRSTFSPDAEENYDDEFRKMREAEVLILDDLGAEQGSAWAKDRLYQLFNYRYNGRLATVVTTNDIGLNGLETRLRSRLRDIRLVKTVVINALDFREQER